MFVTKEKYNELAAAYQKAEKGLSDAMQQIQLLEKTISDQKKILDARADQSSSEADGLQEQIKTLTTRNEKLSGELSQADEKITALAHELSQAESKVGILQQTIDVLTERPAADPAKAHAPSDDNTSGEDINAFMHKNRYNPNVCIAKLREMGF